MIFQWPSQLDVMTEHPQLGWVLAKPIDPPWIVKWRERWCAAMIVLRGDGAVVRWYGGV